MKALNLYKWIAGSANSFTKHFQNSEDLYNTAKHFWDTLESNGPMLILLFIAIGILFAGLYYTLYNNLPGRHYRPHKWLAFLIATFAAGLLVTLAFVCIVAAPNQKGSFLLELRIAFGNAIYSSVVFFIVSVLWCNFFPTNAYRFFKLK